MAEKIYLATLNKQDEILADTEEIKTDRATKTDITTAKDEIIAKIGEGGGASGTGSAIRYQQPTNLIEFYARPRGQGIATAWRDPIDQLLYDRYGLADSTWNKTVVVANQSHFPKNPEDGVAVTNTTRNHFLTPDGENVEVGNWYQWALDPTKRTFFRFFTYSRDGIVNDNEKNAMTYDPDMMNAVIFGASKERALELFQMSAEFGRAVRIGLGLTNEVVEGVNVSGLDEIATYKDLLSNKKLFDAVTSRGAQFPNTAWITQDYDILLAYYKAAPKYFDGKFVTRTMESNLKSTSGTLLRAAILASDTAMSAILASDTAMSAIAASDTAMSAIAANATTNGLKAIIPVMSKPANAKIAYQTVTKSAKFRIVRAYASSDTVSRSNYSGNNKAIIFAVLGGFDNGSATMTSCGASVRGTTRNVSGMNQSSMASRVNGVGFRSATFSESNDGYVLTIVYAAV